MHILVSFCNVMPGAPALGLLDCGTLQFQVLQPRLPDELRRCSGITGLAAYGRYLFVIVQEPDSLRPHGIPGPPSLLIMDRESFEVLTHYVFRLAMDVHSIWACAEELYAVSTGTDEVIKVQLRGTMIISETVVWRPEPDGPRKDVHHLNGIGGSRERLLVSGFGKKSETLWSSAKDGFIVEIFQGATIASQVYHPHSLIEMGGAIAYCESSRMTVRVLGGRRIQTLPGYTRGLCMASSKVFVGTSIGRQASKSTGIVNNPADPGSPKGQCSIARLSPDDFGVEQTIDLTSYAREIYDLLPIEEVGSWPVVSETAWRDRAVHELKSALDERTTWAQRAASQVVEREARIGDLQRRVQAVQQESDANARELRAIQQERDEVRDGFRSLVNRIEVLDETLEAVLRGDKEAIKRIEYRRLVRHIGEVVRENVPATATVLVVSKGDDQLTQLEGRRVWHFPQDRDGNYAGFTPADSGSARVQLEALRAKGAQYLLLPAIAFWWLDHFTEFKRHLDRHYRLLLRKENCCLIYSLCEPPQDQALASSGLEGVIAEYRTLFESEPAILDWDTGLKLTELLSAQVVFEPPVGADGVLPYIDHTVDIVALKHSDPARVAEARRVAGAAVVTWEAGSAALRVEWVKNPQAPPLPTVSIIIPSYNGIALTEACLVSLQETLPTNFQGEIIVVDDCSTDDTEARLLQWAEKEPRLKVLRNEQNCGFLLTCNTGAAAATGDIIVLLNNDTLPQHGWLEPLLRVFRDRPDAGAVGGKLVYPDGRLQEAGGVVFSDGSAANLGKSEYELDAPLYNYVREVDYVTGALIATPRKLFHELDGLDTRYRPIYYEETDYCFRLRERGLKVYYQPESLVIHLEGVTCGTDPGSGQKRHQIVNREKFRERWREALQAQPPPPAKFDSATWYDLVTRGGHEEGNV